MNAEIPQPDEKVQPIRVLQRRDEFVEEARAVGVDDLVDFRAFYTRGPLLFGAVAGPEDGVPVVLLHGFPDFWLGWAPQIRALVEAGARVIIPDQRGYNQSEKPPNIDDYRLPALGGDILDLLDAVGFEDAHLVGHDWGGAVSWWLAQHHPDRLRTVSILNCPHPRVLGKALQFGDLRQMLKSWYIALFQIPGLSEAVVRAGDYGFLKAALAASTREAFSRRELELYTRAWDRQNAVRSMLNWYRASARATLQARQTSSTGSREPIRVPMQIIWGENDAALDASLVEPSAALAEEVEIHWLPEAGHWVQRDSPREVNERLVEFIC